jgi:hypothetical protein
MEGSMTMTKTAAKREITRDDLISMDRYGRERADHRRRMAELKKNRRVAVGPDATFYFENYDTMWYQVHEMLHVEKGGEAQIADELSAYNPLVPNGQELVATLMFEINDEKRRAEVLSRLGGVETTIAFTVDGETVKAVPEQDVERTTAAGKTSSVHFLHFPFTSEQVAKFKEPGARIVLGIEHENYTHMTVLSETVCASLSEDFD